MGQGRRTQPGWPLFGAGDVRIGIVVAVRCEPDGHTPAWLLVKLPGLRRRLRAVPASQAVWLPPGRLAVPYPAEQVAASPVARGHEALEDDAWRERAAGFYAASRPAS